MRAVRAGRTGRGPPAGGDDVKLARSPSPPHRLLDARNGRRWQCGMRAFFGVFGMRISSQSQPPPSLCRKHRLSCTSNSGEVAKNCVQASGVTVVPMFFSIGLTPLRFSSLAREMPCSSASAGAESNEGKISPFQGIRMQVPQAEKKVGGQRRRASTSMLTRGRGNPPVYLPARLQLRPSPRTWPSVLLLCPYRLVCPPLPNPGRRCSSCSSCCYSGKPRSISVVAVRTPLLHDLEQARDSPSRGSITAAPASALHERHARLADTECASPSNHTHVSPRRSNTASPTPFPSPSPNLACYLIPWLPLPLPSFRPLARIWTCPSLSLQGIRPRHLSFTTNPALLPPPPPITASSHPFVPLSRQLHRLCLRHPPCHRPSILYPAPRLVQTLLPILIPATSPIDPLHLTRPQPSVTLPVPATHPPPLRILRTRLHRPPTCRPPRILPLLPHRLPTKRPRKSPQRRPSPANHVVAANSNATAAGPAALAAIATSRASVSGQRASVHRPPAATPETHPKQTTVSTVSKP